MFSLKNLSRTLHLFKPKSLPPKAPQRTFFTNNLAKKSLPISLNLLNILPKSRFCTTTTAPAPEPKDFKCEKINDLYEELTETLNNNIDNITTSLIDKGINASAFFLNRLTIMQYLEKPKIFQILYTNIHRELPTVYDQNVIISIIEGLYNIQMAKDKYPAVPDALIQGVFQRAIKLSPLMNDANLKQIREYLQVFENKNYPETTELLAIISSPPAFSLKGLLKAIDAETLFEDVKDRFEILNFDRNRNYIQVKYGVTGHILDIFGCDPFPSSSLDHITKFFEQNPNTINSLLIEDGPLLVPGNPAEGEAEGVHMSQPEDDRDNSTLAYILEEEDLNYYIKVFVADPDLFDFDKERGVVYTKLNSKLLVPSEVGTSSVHFYTNMDPLHYPRITLMDLTSQENMANMARICNTEQLRDLISFLNYCTLVEKAYFASYSQAHGCMFCRAATMPKLPLPKDMFSIVSGDKELPLDYRTKFHARIIYESISDVQSAHKRSMAVVGSFHEYDLVKNIMSLVKEAKTKELPVFDRQQFMEDNLNELDPSKALSGSNKTEKLALLEAIYQTMDMDTLKSIDPSTMDRNFANYIRYIEEYTYEMSYEKLASENRDIKIRPGECGAETVIFGVSAESNEADDATLETIRQTIKNVKELNPSYQEESDDEPEEKIKLKPSNSGGKGSKKN